MVQIDGMALKLSPTTLADQLATSDVLRASLLRYVWQFHAQVAQTAMCNGSHAVEQRLARWLLMAHDRAGDHRLPLTHELLSTMLGAGCPGVTLAIGAL